MVNWEIAFQMELKEQARVEMDKHVIKTNLPTSEVTKRTRSRPRSQWGGPNSTDEEAQ